MKDAIETASYPPREPSPEDMASASIAASALTNARADDGVLEIRVGDAASFRIAPPLSDLLIELVRRVSDGDMIGLVPANSMLTTNQAADILNVPHPYLMKLLEDGEIFHLPSGYLHRVSLVDLMKYKERRNRERSAALDEIALLGQECDAACTPK